MKIKNVKSYFFTVVIIVIAMCNGCTKNNGEANKEINKENVETDFELPNYNDFVILSDLQNVDLEFYPGQVNCVCDFRIVSTKELDMNKIEVKFDSDIEFDAMISEDYTNEKVFFDYNLMLAYNSLKSKDGVSEVAELPMSEFTKIKDTVKLYSYYVDCVFILDDEGEEVYYEDCEINNLTISYEDKEFSNEIGRICVNNDLLNVDEIDEDNDFIALYCPESLYQTYFYNIDNEFSYSDYSGVFETYDKSVILKNVGFINGKNYQFSRLELEITTDGKTVNTIWESGDELQIPANSIVNITIVGKCDNIANHCGFKANPITEFEFEINGKTVKEYIKVTGTIYGFNKYEVYAVLHDEIDIFDSYYNVLWGEQ